jgi:hypothetical protein
MYDGSEQGRVLTKREDGKLELNMAFSGMSETHTRYAVFELLQSPAFQGVLKAIHAVA